MARETKWPRELIALAKWALRQQDLRHQFLYATTALRLESAPGIAKSIETTLVLAIYEAGLAKGFTSGKTIGYEKPYPSKRKIKGNPKKADLAFKDQGKGKNWAYIEVKQYSGNGSKAIQKDITKLKRIKMKVQRWILAYRIVKSSSKKAERLSDLLLKLNKKSKKTLMIIENADFDTRTKKGEEAKCDICLAKIK